MRRVAAACVLPAGIVLAVGVGGLSDALGVTLLLLTPLSWQICHLLTLGDCRTWSPFSSRGLATCTAAPWWPCQPGRWVAPDLVPSAEVFAAQLPVLALQGVGLSYLGTMLWYLTIARLDLARATAIVVPSIPLLSLGASFLVVGEVPTLGQAAGMLLALEASRLRGAAVGAQARYCPDGAASGARGSGNRWRRSVARRAPGLLVAEANSLGQRQLGRL